MLKYQKGLLHTIRLQIHQVWINISPGCRKSRNPKLSLEKVRLPTPIFAEKQSQDKWWKCPVQTVTTTISTYLSPFRSLFCLGQNSITITITTITTITKHPNPLRTSRTFPSGKYQTPFREMWVGRESCEWVEEFRGDEFLDRSIHTVYPIRSLTCSTTLKACKAPQSSQVRPKTLKIPEFRDRTDYTVGTLFTFRSL